MKTDKLEVILTLVSNHFDQSREIIMGKSKKPDHATPRQVCWYLMREQGFRLIRIAKFFNTKPPRILGGINKTKDFISIGDNVKEHVTILTKKIKEHEIKANE
jgi:chromosomal replication initiation ATPase DnaA